MSAEVLEYPSTRGSVRVDVDPAIGLKGAAPKRT
ncbi:hypothetical protein OEIGOIKO_01828 [Streptomyces chrestomyceticus JCM 4735]|uniref:Uncharacterized protein n=1 Tax=Streptomyces chrestomyceticus JCM 4735 TaxID=1306181 RepID=A0A7U9PWD5_9ACTN|nr:hypothetical protein OEIGOIKO_01828 [Streptomyces chrestomyceticus JCM 4735]